MFISGQIGVIVRREETGASGRARLRQGVWKTAEGAENGALAEEGRW